MRSSPFSVFRFSFQFTSLLRLSTYRRVTLLGLLSVAGEDNEAGLVGLQTLNVKSLALLAQVSPSVVNNDTNSAGLLATDSSLLQLSKSETAAFPDLAVVTNGLSTDSGAEEVKRADTKASGLLLAGLATANLAAGLVKPCTNTDLPVLAEVVLVED